MEIWRPVHGFERFYEVSSLGRVRSLDKIVQNSHGKAIKKGKILRQSISPKTGYCSVALWHRRKGKSCLVHRLVAYAFQDICGDFFEGAQVDHINTIRTDNRAQNLKWCTCSGNHNNPLTKIKTSESRKGKKRISPVWNKDKKLPQFSGENSSRSRKIIQYSNDGTLIKIWNSTTEAGVALSISRTSITNCLTGRSNSAKNFIWKYKEN